MKNLIILFLIVGSSVNLFAQDCGLVEEIGDSSKWTYTSFSSTDVAGTVSNFSVVSSTKTKGNMVAKVSSKTKSSKVEQTIACKGGSYHVSPKILSLTYLASINDPEASITEVALQFPLDAAVGTTLPNASISITSSKASTPYNINITDRKVIEKETVTTSAGSFDCYVVLQTTTSTSNGMSSFSVTKHWFSPEAGLVKFETFGDDMKIGYTQITSLKK